MQIFNVTTIKNIESVFQSVINHSNLHGYERYTVICPEKEVEFFKIRFSNFTNIEILSENRILSFSRFSEISNSCTKYFFKSDVNPKRLNWYYQQVLKIAFALECESEFLLMWDADTIPLKKIEFFNGNISLSYGSFIEFHYDYFQSINEIFKFKLPKMSFTIQFFTLTQRERLNLINKLNNYRKKNDHNSVAEWIAIIVISSVASKHNNLESKYHSYFSEQELVGLANTELNDSKQKGIKHFRPGRYWKMTKLRLFVLKSLGYKYITLERNLIPKNSLQEILYFWLFIVYDSYRHFFKNKSFY